MSLIATLKARTAAQKLAKGDAAAAKHLYEEAIAGGLSDPRYLLSYSVLLIRDGEYQKAREFLVKLQSNPALSGESKKQLFVNYAACVYKLGDLPKAIAVLEGQHAKDPSGMIYETLGYLYVEAGETEKALQFNQAALEYDDEDPITLDNLGQTYYRMVGDKAKALEYFQKAHQLKTRTNRHPVFSVTVRYRKRRSCRSERKTGIRAGRPFLSPEFCDQRQGERFAFHLELTGRKPFPRQALTSRFRGVIFL